MAGRAHYTIQIKSGKGTEEITFEGPDGLTDQEIEDLADKQLRTAKPGQSFPHSVRVGGDVAHAPDESSAVGSFVRSLPKAATFNFDDEIRSAANAAIPGVAGYENFAGLSGGHQQGPGEGDFWSRFRNNMGDYRSQAEADQALHPTASFLGNMTGVVSSLPAAAETVAARIPEAATAFMKAHPYLTASVFGGLGGAASGAGEGEGNRGQSAALGGFTGMALGPALVGASELLPAIARYGKIFFNKASHSEAVQQIIKALQRDGFDVTSPTGVVKLKSALQEYSGKPVSLADIGSATRSRTGVGLRTPSDAQQSSIDQIFNRQAGQGQRLAKDIRATVAPRSDVHALDEQLVAQRAEQARELRDQALFREVPPTTRMEDRVFKPSPLSSDAQAAADKYAAEQGTTAEWTAKTLADQIEEMRLIPGFENHPVSINEVQGLVLDDMGISRDAPGAQEFVKDVFNRANSRIKLPQREVKIPGGRQSIMVDDPQLQQLAQLPIAKRAREAAYNQAENERGILASQGQDISHIPALNDEELDMRGFDYLKRFLDDQVSGLYRGDTGTFTKAELNNVKSLRDAIRGRLRKVQPDGSIGAEDGPYAKYLDAYKGSSEMIDSLRAGREYNKLDPEQIISEQAGRSEAGRELYRVGAARNLLDTLRESKDTGNPASRILNSDEARAQLNATGVTPANAARLNKSVEQERIFNLLPRELAGSNTDARLAARADADTGLDHLVPIIPGNPMAWMGMMGRKALSHVSAARNAAVNAEALPRLLETNPQAVEGIISELELQGKLDQARVLRRQLRAIQGAGVGGTIIGGPVSLPTLED